MSTKKSLKKKIRGYLSVPDKAIAGDENENIEEMLGDFLIENEYIRETDKRDEDWGFVYYSVTRKISVSEKEMPHQKWEDCIFKMGKNIKTGEDLFPNPGVETKKYRFLHEANHAYQEYLCFRESPENPKEWYQKSVQGELNSSYSLLFNFCFRKREEADINKKEGSPQSGLSIWGNAQNYDYKGVNDIPNKASEIAVRSQEDANELVTMFLWHPSYFEIYLDYLSLNYENNQIRERELTKEDLEKCNLVFLSKNEVDILKKIVRSYTKEMKKNIENGS